MATNYNEIAAAYISAQTHPIKQYVETFSFLRQVGNLEGKSALDLACGDGYYTRLLKQQGAAAVVGVDLSKRMIDSARQQETAAPLGITYQQGDARRLGVVGQFDVVSAQWLLPYASTPDMLTAMCQTIYNNLKPGGRLLSITFNPWLRRQDFPRYKGYGLTLTADGPLQDGLPITTAVEYAGLAFDIVALHWGQEAYEVSLRQAGFTELTWRALRLSEEGLATFGSGYWQTLLERPYAIMLEGYRSMIG